MNEDSKWLPLAITSYHEAGHIVVASVLGMALKSDGIRIWEMAEGETCGAVHIWEDENDWEKTLIFLRSGVKSQLKQFPQSITRATGAHDEEFFSYIVIKHFVDEKPPNANEIGDKKRYQQAALLWAKGVKTCEGEMKDRANSKADLLLEKHWSAVEAIAQAVIDSSWKPGKNEGIEAKRQKHLDGSALVTILEKHGISAVVR